MADYDLCTAAEVKTFLQKTDAGADTILAALVSRASRAIIRYTGREFAPTVSATTRTFWYRGGGTLDFGPYDLRSATLVRIDTETASPTTLTADDDYYLEPVPTIDGVYQWMELPAITTETRRQVQITGNWGFDAVPEDVKHAAIQTVVRWYRGQVAGFSREFEPDDGTVIDDTKFLPRAARAILGPYTRINVA